MTVPRTVASLFEQEPARWGLRGDPYLWKEMREHFKQTLIPATANDLVDLIEAAFKSLTGHSVSESEAFFVERLSHGGMSSGVVSPEFWRVKVIPLMRIRFGEW